MTKEEAVAKAKEEGANWMMENGPVLLFWKEEDGRLTECAIAMRVKDGSYEWLGWLPSILHRPSGGIMERLD